MSETNTGARPWSRRLSAEELIAWVLTLMLGAIGMACIAASLQAAGL
jgi:hypothetical protein